MENTIDKQNNMSKTMNNKYSDTTVTVVGVEGSGKTVLMSSLGELYEHPDANGYFLSPESAKSFNFVKLQMANMRKGNWPAATPETNLSVFNWSLYHKESGPPCKLTDVSFLDFGGEVYRKAFVDSSAAFEGDAEVKVLRERVSDSNILVVLINLSDIINSSVENKRDIDTLWITKSILDFFTKCNKIDGNHQVAMVFSQADSYREIISKNNGLENTLKKYLPHVANAYDNIPVFAVSAVDNTTINTDGFVVPTDNFTSRGLQPLMNWIIKCCNERIEYFNDLRNQKITDIKSSFANQKYQIAYDACVDLDFYDLDLEMIKIKCLLFHDVKYENGPEYGTPYVFLCKLVGRNVINENEVKKILAQIYVRRDAKAFKKIEKIKRKYSNKAMLLSIVMPLLLYPIFIIVFMCANAELFMLSPIAPLLLPFLTHCDMKKLFKSEVDAS